jgi:hypothetical protein
MAVVSHSLTVLHAAATFSLLGLTVPAVVAVVVVVAVAVVAVVVVVVVVMSPPSAWRTMSARRSHALRRTRR